MSQGQIISQQLINYPPKEGVEIYLREDFTNAGQDSYSSPPGQDPDKYMLLKNVLPVTKGNLQKRWGYSSFMNDTFNYRRMFAYRNESAGTRKIVYCSTGHVRRSAEDGTGITDIFTPSGGADIPWMVCSRDYGYFSDGVSGDLKKWDGATTVTKWGIAAGGTAVSVGAPTAGSITLNQGRKYYAIFRNSTTGSTSDLNPVSASTGPVTSKNIPLSNIPVSADAQVDKVDLLATADGGDESTLFFLAEINNGVTTYTDSTVEENLLAANVYLETDASGIEHGVADNTPPPNGTQFIKHQGRLITFVGQFLYVSKNLDEVTTSTGTITSRYEEAWPAVYVLDISQEAEQIRGLLSDGVNLYVSTERHIYRILGDSPSNFSKPERLFNECGIANKDVWKVVFNEGQPIGAIWLTPDGKVILSNFDTYQDIGTPVQDILNTINQSQLSVAHATYFGANSYDLFVLCIPTGSNTSADTMLVYDMRRKIWLYWTLTDKTSAVFYNVNSSGTPQFLFAGPTTVYSFNYTSTTCQDRGLDFNAVVQTSWLDFGDPASRKALNEMELMTGDSGMTVTVEGASTDAEFATPLAITNNVSMTTGPFGEFKVMLAGKATKSRNYRFTLTSATSPVANSLLDTLRIEYVPISRL